MIDDRTILAIIVVITSYLIGSLPTAYLLAKTRNINIFEIGSGNMGGTNVVRAMGWRWGLMTAIIDVFKGIVAIIIAREILMPNSKGTATTISAIVVIVGHNWSLFATLLTATFQNGRIRATFRGGKGAATAFGTMLIIAPWHLVLATMALGGLIIALTRYVSLGVLVAYSIALAWLLVLIGSDQLPLETTAYVFALAMLLIIRFRGNIQRLLTGTERRIGDPA